jgi:hypothetical protein
MARNMRCTKTTAISNLTAKRKTDILVIWIITHIVLSADYLDSSIA